MFANYTLVCINSQMLKAKCTYSEVLRRYFYVNAVRKRPNKGKCKCCLSEDT